MYVKIKKTNPDAVIPAYSKPGDAGMDIVAVSKDYENYGNIVVYGTGICVEIPEGYVGLVFPRSSLSKMDLSLCNSVGVIDSGYRGEIKFKFRRLPSENPKEYEIGDRIGQIVIIPYPYVNFIESQSLSDSERGDGGFGSTGK